MRVRGIGWFAVVALWLGAVSTVVCLVGCGRKRAVTSARMQVVVSIFPIYDLVRRVAGPDADVTLLLTPAPRGEMRNASGFVPTAKDAEAVAGARVVVMVGLGLDPWLGELVQSRGVPKVRVLKVGDRVPTLTAAGKPYVESGEGGARVDPHVWLDPQRASVMSKAIGEELARADSAHAGAYRRRADEVADALDVLDKDMEARVRSWPGTTVATSQAGFAYFADRYHLQVAPVGPDAPSTPLIDTLGGGPGVDTYEKLIQYDANGLAKTLR